MIEIISGSILDAKEKYILHQTNCVTNRSAYLAQSVFNAFPWADIYCARKSSDVPGTIIIRGNGIDQRYVINLLGQYYPGKPKYPDSSLDGTKAREKYFHKGLLCVSKIPDLESIAIPVRIGCGAAGGNWTNYLGTIKNFEKFVFDKYNTKVVLYDIYGN